MQYLIKDEKLKLKYQPGKGAWTYHLRIPNLAAIEGNGATLKFRVSLVTLNSKRGTWPQLKAKTKCFR